MGKDLLKARERSVSNLQRLYTVVVSLAIAECLRRLVGAVSAVGVRAIDSYYGHFLMFGTFIATVVPFFHGANRYLDATYVTGERDAKDGALMIDFGALFLEALILFVLAMTCGNIEYFYSTLMALLLLDILWVGSTQLTSKAERDKAPRFTKWALVNSAVVILIFVSTWSSLLGFTLWRNVPAQGCFLVLLAAARTVFDYVLVC